MDGKSRLARRIQTHADATRGGRVNFLDQRSVDGKTPKNGHRLIATVIGTNRPEKGNLRAKTGRMAGKVGRGAAETGAFRKEIPEHLSTSEDAGFTEALFPVRHIPRSCWISSRLRPLVSGTIVFTQTS